MDSQVIRTKVVIVGAGMTGLGAAHTFTKSNFSDFIILDALEQPGGRIHTVPLGNGVLELGAQWVHGVGTTLHELAVANDLIHAETSNEGEGIYLRDDGAAIDPSLVAKVDFRVGQILEACEGFTDAETYPRSVGEFLETEFAKYVEESDDDEESLWELYDWHVRFQLIDNSCGDLRHVSAKEWGRYSCLGKDGQAHINLKRGYRALVDLLVEQLPENTLKLECPVTKIAINQETLIELHCSGGLRVIAEHLVLTPSVSVLKRKPELLGFPLPENIIRAVESMGFSGMGKVFLVFEEPWWNPSGYQLIFRRKQSPKHWTNHISGFDPVLDQPNVLLAWVADAGAREMEEMSDEDVGKDCVDLLRVFLRDDLIPYPVKVYKSNWISCEWIGGGYSHTTPDCDAEGVGAATLSEPVCFGGTLRVVFAGEAAHPTHFSTTHGAFESGEEQARKILAHVQKGPKGADNESAG